MLFLVSHMMYSQVTGDKITGSWQGILDAGSVKLRLGFNISVGDDGNYQATLDSPDQGANGIPMGKITYEGDSLRIDAPMINGYYLGVVTSDSTIQGEWNQNNMSFDLNLKRHVEPFVLNRPQEPAPPFPYMEEEVEFQNEEQDFSLGGTLTLPGDEGPFPCVILVSGSGAHNRDEEIYGHKPFKVIADFLTRKGIAVLRYDDRGVGSSGGNYQGSTTLDHAGDARAAINYLKKRREIDPSKIGVIGHSEGGMIAIMLASEYPDIAFIITLAGPGVDGKTILLDQTVYIYRHSGVPEPTIEDSRTVLDKVYDIMISNESYDVWRTEVLSYTRSFYSDDKEGYSEEDIDLIEKRLMASIPEPSYNWLRYFAMFDPSDYLGTIRCPVLALNGEKDCQVLASQNIQAIREGLARSGNEAVTVRIIPDLNHLFQHCETGLPGEYTTIEETFDEDTLDLISDWIRKK